MLTCGDIFSGGGGWSTGASLAGLTPLWAIESDPAIAEVYAANLGSHVIVEDAAKVNINRLEPVDVLLASPPCQSHSQARSKKLPKRDDAEIGVCVLDYIRILKPKFIFIENVEGWKRSKSFLQIFDGLHSLGYWTNVQVLNAADFAVPQTRRRLILRASREGMLPALPLPVQWRGWYQAIEDLIPTLPESRFAEWQLKRLPEKIHTFLANHDQSEWVTTGCATREATAPANTIVGASGGRLRAFIATVQDENSDIHYEAEPSPTITSGHGAAKYRAFIVEGSAAGEDNPYPLPVRDADEPVFTMRARQNNPRAFIVDQRNGGRDSTVKGANEPVFTQTNYSVKHPAPRAWLSQGHVVSMTPRALARFQSFPDSYELPQKNALACRVIGNAVPALLAQRLLEAIA